MWFCKKSPTRNLSDHNSKTPKPITLDCSHVFVIVDNAAQFSFRRSRKSITYALKYRPGLPAVVKFFIVPQFNYKMYILNQRSAYDKS